LIRPAIVKLDPILRILGKVKLNIAFQGIICAGHAIIIISNMDQIAGITIESTINMYARIYSTSTSGYNAMTSLGGHKTVPIRMKRRITVDASSTMRRTWRQDSTWTSRDGLGIKAVIWLRVILFWLSFCYEFVTEAVQRRIGSIVRAN
jgi:hypothetical protein